MEHIRSNYNLKIFQINQGEFTKIKRGRSPIPVSSEFKVKLSNKFDMLIEEETSEISDEVINLEPIPNPQSSGASSLGGGGLFTAEPGMVIN